MTTQDVRQRLKTLNFFEKHGKVATCDAFDVSAGAPHDRWQLNQPPALVAQIKILRTQFPSLGKVHLHVLL